VIKQRIRTSKKTTEAILLMGKMVEQSTGEASPDAQVKINRKIYTVDGDPDGNFEVQSIKTVRI
jgi:hypothetical protein